MLTKQEKKELKIWHEQITDLKEVTKLKCNFILGRINYLLEDKKEVKNVNSKSNN